MGNQTKLNKFEPVFPKKIIIGSLGGCCNTAPPLDATNDLTEFDKALLKYNELKMQNITDHNHKDDAIEFMNGLVISLLIMIASLALAYYGISHIVNKEKLQNISYEHRNT